MRERDESESQEDKCQCFGGIVTEGLLTEPDEAERMAEGMKRCREGESQRVCYKSRKGCSCFFFSSFKPGSN